MFKNITLMLFFSVVSLFAKSGYILHNEDILIDKAAAKIEKMCDELYAKTGTAVYVSAVNTLKERTITLYAQEMAKGLEGEFALLVFAGAQKQIELVMSPEVESFIDKDEILDGYIIPILVAKTKDTTPQQQYSAGIFNGIAELTDQIAKKHDIVLENSVGSQSKNFYEGLMWVIKLLLLITVAIFAYAYLKNRKEKRQ